MNLTETQKRKYVELTMLAAQRKEEKRRANILSPASQSMSIQNQIKKDQYRAQQRVRNVTLGLMQQYCNEQGIEFDEMQERISEDPMIIENFYAEALELIPEHYHPHDPAPNNKFLWKGSRGTFRGQE